MDFELPPTLKWQAHKQKQENLENVVDQKHFCISHESLAVSNLH